MRGVIDAAARSNVSIFAIDPRGLTDMGDLSIELNGVSSGDGLSDQQLQSLGPRGLQNELRLQHNSLLTANQIWLPIHETGLVNSS